MATLLKLTRTVVSILRKRGKQQIDAPPEIESCDTKFLDEDDRHYYQGYRAGDLRTPWARHFQKLKSIRSKEADDRFVDGMLNSPFTSELGLSIQAAPKALQASRYTALENGWTKLADGTLYIAVLTDMGDVTGEMLDFWFYWHMNCSSKYKLWHPDDHRYAWAQRKNCHHETIREMGYKERYWNMTSCVNEYIGSTSSKFSIGFFDPRLYKFALITPETDSAIETVITAFVVPGQYTPLDPQKQASKGPEMFRPTQILLMHQLRRKPDGSGKYEMRSRFWIGSWLTYGMRIIGKDPNELAKDLAAHCHVEMTQLAKILPGVFEEFGSEVW